MAQFMSLRRGFTLIEMLVVVAILGVLAALVAPSFNEQLARRRLEGVTTDLTTDLQFARTQAVDDRSAAAFSLITQNSGTSYTLVNGAGTTVKTATLPADVGVTPNITVAYDQLRGTLSPANAQSITVASIRTAASLTVNVNVMGRVSVCAPGGVMKGYTAC